MKLNRKQWEVLAIGIPLIIGMYFFSQWYGEFNRNLSKDFQFLTYAIFTGGIALFLHFFKEWKYVKDNLPVLYLSNSFELLLLVVTPILSLFQIFIKEYPQHMLILLTIGVFSWWIVTVIRTNNSSGKFALVMSLHLYSGLIVIVGLFAWLIALVN